MRLAISIAHAAHRPERRESLARLLARIGPHDLLKVEDSPGKPHEWSMKQWEWAAGQDATHALFLEDDMIPCDGFIDVVASVIAARPDHILNLYNMHELAKDAQRQGLSWLTTREGLIGTVYAMPVPALRDDFLPWRANTFKHEHLATISHDNLINLWAMQRGSLIWHTVPALCDHDLTVDSCYGQQQMRTPPVLPSGDLRGHDWNTDALHVGTFFRGNHHRLLTAIKGDRLPLVTRYYEVAGDTLVES